MKLLINALIISVPLLPITALLAVVAWLEWRRGWIRRQLAYSRRLRRPARSACLTEAAMLWLLSVITLTVLTFQPHDGGLVIARNRPDVETLAWGLAAATLAVCTITVTPALFGRALVAILATGLVLAGYGLAVTYREAALAPLMPSPFQPPPTTFTFEAETEDDTPIPADLWLNGMHIGRTPVTISRRLLDGIPVWNSPPPSVDPPSSWIGVIRRSPWHTGKMDTAWSKVNICIDSGPKGWRTYFARIRCAGQWAYSHGGNGTTDQWSMGIHFPMPDRLPIERLLEQARARDYVVDADWLAAMDSLGNVGWAMFIKRATREPELAELARQWIAWKYGIDQLRTTDDAWRVFDRICRDANDAGWYSSNSREGHAVALLAPKLDPEQLISIAEWYIARDRVPPWVEPSARWPRLFFGYPRRAQGRVDLRMYAVVHAIWELDRSLDFLDDRTPNIVESRIPLALLTYHLHDQDMLLFANALGGCPELDRYLLRQDWTLTGSKLEDNRLHCLQLSHSRRVNKWLYLLAALDSPTGASFRQQHRPLIVRMADDCFDEQRLYLEELPEFLFADLDKGSKSLAAEYWPRFVSMNPAEHGQLVMQFEYLIRMEPVSTTDMYVQAWRSHEGLETDYGGALKLLNRLPVARVHEIVSALRYEIEKPAAASRRESLRQYLDECIVRSDRRPQAEKIMADLAGERVAEMRKAIPEWLAHEEPDHPVVELLAASHDPTLRILAMNGLRAHPTPGRRAILDRLLADPDPQVQDAAREVRADLDRLIATPPAELIRVTETPDPTVPSAPGGAP